MTRKTGAAFQVRAGQASLWLVCKSGSCHFGRIAFEFTQPTNAKLQTLPICGGKIGNLFRFIRTLSFGTIGYIFKNVDFLKVYNIVPLKICIRNIISLRWYLGAQIEKCIIDE